MFAHPLRLALTSLLTALLATVGVLAHSSPSAADTTAVSIWTSTARPVQPSDPDDARVSIGTEFKVDRDGVVLAIRFYKSPENSGPHTGFLWSSSGVMLAKVTFSSSNETGWASASLPAPVELEAGRSYVVSYVAPEGRYADDAGTFSNGKTIKSGPLTATRGLYSYSGNFPTEVWRDSAYYADVVFEPGGSVSVPPVSPTTAPSPTTTTPQPSGSTTGSPQPSATQSSSSTPQPSTPTSSPSATTGETPGSRPLGCALSPSKCGYPDATNTGSPSGTKMVRVPADTQSGPGWAWNSAWSALIVSGAGATLNALDVSGQIVVDAPNVTVSNSRISACGGFSDNDVVAVRYRASDPSYRGSNARIIDNTILGTPPGCDHRARSGVRDVYGEAPGLVVDGNNISGAGNGVTAEFSGPDCQQLGSRPRPYCG